MKKTAAISLAGALLCATVAAPAQEPTPAAKSLTSATTPTSSTAVKGEAPKPNTLLDGTPVKLRLGRTISSSDARVGDQVDFEVLEEIKVDGVIVIPKGAIALATVTTAEHKKSMGRAGKLDVNIDSVRLADGEKAALRATEGGKAGGHVGAMTGAMVATSIVFFPAAPLFLFIHGKDMTIPKGTPVTAYVNGDMTIDRAKFLPIAMDTASTTAAATSAVAVDANVPNCDIEVDGAFVGNTPSQLSLSPGKHEITVKKGGYAPWIRTVMVSGSGVNLKAELSPSASAEIKK
ncbi:MAG: PEGA domain-containing protein [Acidobacteria bacterium]|nr:PEGA domain-containing protein [Acidobacteriota bacterium]MBW4044496.1 PEGA domain-containing protein [Acidobacteriota bacterium]